jgi:Flp pilus assembly protein TadG
LLRYASIHLFVSHVSGKTLGWPDRGLGRIRKQRRFLRARSGVAAVEFAFVIPILILLAAGIAEIGRAMVFYNSVNQLAAQYASAWADCQETASSCSMELGYYTSTYSIQNIAPNLSVANLTLKMADVTMTGTTPTVVYCYPSTTLTAVETTAAQANFSSGQTGVIVYVSYTYSLAYFPSYMSSAMANALTATYTVTQIKN